MPNSLEQAFVTAGINPAEVSFKAPQVLCVLGDLSAKGKFLSGDIVLAKICYVAIWKEQNVIVP